VKVIAVPRNGLGNRLQMLASSYVLSRNLQAEFEIVWTNQTVFPARFDSVFTSMAGMPIHEKIFFAPEEYPTFTTVNSKNMSITLRNLRAGDQIFMPKLRKLIRKNFQTRCITIISGEKFNLNEGRYFKDSQLFRSLRKEFYEKLVFSDEVNHLIRETENQFEGPYWAIHLRETDRKNESLAIDAVVKEIMQLKNIPELQTQQVYIATDDHRRGLELSEKLTILGFKPKYLAKLNRDRLTEKEAVHSLLDWVILSRATRIVSYGTTTFSYEAAVAGGTFDKRIHIDESVGKKVIRSIRKELLNFRLYGKFPYTTYMFWKRQNEN
jgi:hypothetical protein